jgi:hypothetical protein
MAKPTKRQLEIILNKPIGDTPEEFQLALQEAQDLQEMEVLETYIGGDKPGFQTQYDLTKLSIENNPTYTPEQKQQRLMELDVLKGSGQLPSFGGYYERTLNRLSPPLEATSAGMGMYDLLGIATGRQQTIGDVRAQIEKPTTINARQTFEGLLRSNVLGQEPIEQDAYINASMALYDRAKRENPTYTDKQVFDAAVEQLNKMYEEPSKITQKEAEKLDPRTKAKFGTGTLSELAATAVDYQRTTGTDLPMYSDEQLAYFQSIEDAKYESVIEKNRRSIADPRNAAQSMPVTYLFEVGKGDIEFVPQEVLTYLQDNPTGGVVYDAERDAKLIRMIRDGDYEKSDRKDITFGSRQDAVARVRAYKELGNPDWKKSLDKRKAILSDLPLYDEVGAFETETAIGGTTESTVGFVLRNAFAVSNAGLALGVDALNIAGGAAMGAIAEGLEYTGMLPELPPGESYFDPMMTSRLREAERPPLYQGYGYMGAIADNIARNKGAFGEGQAISEQLNLEGWQKFGTEGAYFALDLVEPSFDLGSGAVKGGQKYIKTMQASKLVHDAPSYAAAKKAAKTAFIEEMPLIQGAQQISQRLGKGKMPKGMQTSDVMLTMSNNVARNLEAERMVNKEFATYDDLARVGLDDTEIALQIKKGAEPVDASLQFRQKMMNNEDTAKILKEYDESLFLLDNTKRRFDIESALKDERLVRNLPNANQDMVRRAFDDVDPSDPLRLQKAQQNLATMYGRALFFEIAPKNVDLENLQWITKNTMVDKSRVADIIAKAAKSKVGEAFNKVMKFTDGQLISAQKPSTEPSYNILGQMMAVRPTEVKPAFDLEGMADADINEILESIDTLNISPTLKQDIKDNISIDKTLFVDDYNRILSANRDKVARMSPDAATIEDINRLDAQARARLLEAEGTVGRTADTVIGDMRRKATEYISQTAVGKKIRDIFVDSPAQTATKKVKALFNAVEEPIANTTPDLAMQQRRILAQHNAQMGTLPIRTQKLFNDLVENRNNIVESYLPYSKETLTAEEALGLMIVGERSRGVGAVEQQVNIQATLKWLLSNTFVQKIDIESPRFSQADNASGIQQYFDNSIWNGHGKAYIEQELEKLSLTVQDDPLAYWSEVQRIMEDINSAIQGKDAASRMRPVEVVTEDGIEFINKPIVDANYNADTVPPITEIEMNERFGLLNLSAYYVSESQREMARLLSDTLQEDFTELAVKNLVEGTDVNQAAFEQSVKAAANIMYATDVDEMVRYNQIKEVVQSAHMEEVLNNLDTSINVFKIDEEIVREMRRGAEEFNKSQGSVYNNLVKEEAKNNKAKLLAKRDQLKESKKNMLDRFDRQRDTILASEKQRIKDELEAEIKKIPEEKRRNPDFVRIEKERDAAIRKVQADAEKARKKVTKLKLPKEKASKQRKAITDEADQKIKDLQAKATAEKNVIRKEFKDQKKYGVDLSPAVRKLNKEASAKFTAEKNKFVKERANLNEALINRKNQQLKEYKKELFADTERLLQQVMDRKVGVKDEMESVRAQLQNMKTIEEKIAYLKQNVTDYNPDFDVLAEKVDDAMLDNQQLADLATVVENHAEIVLRNNNYSYALTGDDWSGVKDGLDALFANDGYAAAVLGEANFKQLKNELLTKTLTNQQRVILEVLRAEPGALDGIHKVANMLNNALYISVLGLRPSSHVRNIITAPTLLYQTTGELLTPSLAKRGAGVVFDGSRVNSKGYGKIAVTTPDGMVYTNADIFTALQRAGVKSQFQFIQSEFQPNSPFMKQVNDMYNDNLSNFAYEFIKDIPNKSVALQTHEDFTFRAAVMIKALEDGRSLEEAVALARRSLFDYSDISPDLNKAFRAVLVFSSFTYQNIMEGMRAFSNPSMLKRYAKMIRAIKTSNALLRSFNENKQLPYQMYYPEFAQNRIVFELNAYDNKIAFAMAPAIPAVDSMTQLIGLSTLLLKPTGMIESKDIDALEPFINLLMPIYKEILPLERKYEPGKVKPEVVQLFKTVYGAETPNEIAMTLERFAGGRVYPKLAKEGDKSAIDGYVYPLDASQRKKLYHESFYTMMQMTGMTAQLMDTVRLIAPEGTNYERLNGFQRMGAIFGLYSISTATDPDVQQAINLQRKLSEMRKIERGETEATFGAILRDTNLIQPSEER